MTRTHQSGEPHGAILMAALERAWDEIRARHPEIPAAVLITGSGSDGRRRGLRLGHFAACRWRGATDERDLPEIFVAGEGLKRGAVPVLATLLHEAAHALAEVRGVKDVSRQGRYHNRRFKALAEELDLEVAQAPVIGWSVTSLAEASAVRYASTVAELDRAITLHRRREPAVTGSGPARNPVACLCGCPRRIRVAASVLALGPIVCGVCGGAFEPRGESRPPGT